MINLITECRKIATLLAAILAAASFSTLAPSNVQEGPDELESSNQVIVEAPVPPLDSDPDLDVLMRGPLHEAFAEVYQHDASPSTLVPQEPPEDIEELPPEYQPEGKNVEWIPGYWAWDEERVDFIWISGIWRDVPPGKRWIPGYWQTSEGGYRWVSGFWVNEEQQELGYLPQPPTSIDNGPSSAAPTDDHYYVPGNWVYQDSDYLWRAGFWAPRKNNWIWVPARYVWTPNGCIYRAGYWDYELDVRGVVFAPVYFRAPVYRQLSYRYTPAYVINTDYDFMAHLFIRPSCNQYYFGDWYGASYVSGGFYSWSSYHRTTRLHRVYDPMYAYYSCRSSRYNDVALMTWVRTRHQFYDRNRDCRPRHTYVAQVKYAQSNRQHQNYDAIRKASLGESYRTRVGHKPGKNKVASGRFNKDKFNLLAKNERQSYVDANTAIRAISQKRKKQELQRKTGGKKDKLVVPKQVRNTPKTNRQIAKSRKLVTESRVVKKRRDIRQAVSQRKLDPHKRQPTQVSTKESVKSGRTRSQNKIQSSIAKTNDTERERRKNLLARQVEEKINQQSRDRFDRLRQQRVDDQTRQMQQTTRIQTDYRIAESQRDARHKAENEAQTRASERSKKQQAERETVRKQVAAYRQAQQRRFDQLRNQSSQEAQRRESKQREAKRRSAKLDSQEQVQRQRENQTRSRPTATRQREQLNPAAQQRAKLLQQETRQRAQQQHETRQREQQNRAAQQRAKRLQQETQQRAQQQREARQRTQQQNAQRKREVQHQRAQQQRSQREAQKNADRQRQRQRTQQSKKKRK